jgi:hypothetical protein
MSNKLTKLDVPAWGENLSAFLQVCRENGDTELIQQIEERLTASYLLGIRKAFQEDPVANKIAADAIPAISAKGLLVDHLWHLVKPGSEDIFERSITIILEELEEARQKPPSLYLVSMQTGRSILPLPKNGIFQPPDFEGEDGQLHKARLTVHPSITSALGLAAQETEKKAILLKKAQNPAHKHAYAHLAGPEKIVDSAKERLKSAGVIVVAELAEIYPAFEIEFGREHRDGITQSPNFQFHRANLFSAVVAQKILRICGSGGECQIGAVREMTSSKQRWFIVPVRIRVAPQLPLPEGDEPVRTPEQT